MEDDVVVFRDRRDAGRRLATKLQDYRGKAATVVLGLPRGGVVTAAEIAAALGLPLDVIISRKIGAPGNPELAIGAVAEYGEPYLNEEGMALTRASQAYVDEEVARQRAEIGRRQVWFRGAKALSLPEIVILVDDGVATGATVIAAVRALRRQKVARIVLAVPVAPPDTATVLRKLVDELVVLATPGMFWAVGEFYEDFSPVSDDEVRELLAEAGKSGTARGRTRGRRMNQGTERHTSSAPCEDPRAPDDSDLIEITIPVGDLALHGILGVPSDAVAIVLFAHGSGSGRLSPRNTYVADVLRGHGLATLLFDLLTEKEARDPRNVFDVALLAERLRTASQWTRRLQETKRLPLGYFGASTGAAAALIAAAFDPDIGAVVSRGGRPDLAASVLSSVTAPTLLIVGGEDHGVLQLNDEALSALRCEKRLEIIAGAGHLFEESGALEQVADLAARWFTRHLARQSGELKKLVTNAP